MRADVDIWLREVIRAWRSLGAETVDERQLIAELLGFRLPERSPKLGSTVRTQPAAPSVPSPAAVREPVTPSGERDPAGLAAAQAITPVVVPLRPVVQSAFTQTAAAPAWQVNPVPLATETNDHLTFMPPLEPLFE